jgi:hypothetical protein
MQVGFLLRWAGCMVSALVTKTRRFTQAFGELPETHSEPQIDFSTCYGACGLKAPVANPQTRIRAPACKAANLTLPSCSPHLIHTLQQSQVLPGSSR